MDVFAIHPTCLPLLVYGCENACVLFGGVCISVNKLMYLLPFNILALMLHEFNVHIYNLKNE